MASIITLEDVKNILGERPRDIHKRQAGSVLLIAGSKPMAGAAVLCARAVMRAGGGLIRVSVGEELFPIIQTAVP